MHEKQSHGADAHEFCVSHVIHVLLSGNFRSHKPCEAWYEQYAQSQYDVVLAAAEDGDEYQSQKDAGESQDTVVYTHEYLVEPAAEVACEKPDKDTYNKADGTRVMMFHKKDCATEYRLEMDPNKEP